MLLYVILLSRILSSPSNHWVNGIKPSPNPERKRQVELDRPDTTRFLSTTVFLCSEFKLENICSGVNFCGKNVCGYFYLRGLIFADRWKNRKNRKNFLPHGKTQSVDGFRLNKYNQRYFSSPWPAKSYNYAKKKQTNKQKQAMN